MLAPAAPCGVRCYDSARPRRLGAVDARPGYHTPHALWPVGLCAEVADAAAGTFRSEVLDGGADGPRFRVSLVPPGGEAAVRTAAAWLHALSSHLRAAPQTCARERYVAGHGRPRLGPTAASRAQVLAEERDPDAAWERVARLQAGLLAAAAAGAAAQPPGAAAGAAPAPAPAPQLPGGAEGEPAAALRRAAPLHSAWGTHRSAPAAAPPLRHGARRRRERARRAQVRAGGRARAQGAGGAAGRGRAGRLRLRGGARALGAGGAPPGARAGQARQAAGAPRAFC